MNSVALHFPEAEGSSHQFSMRNDGPYPPAQLPRGVPPGGNPGMPRGPPPANRRPPPPRPINPNAPVPRWDSMSTTSRSQLSSPASPTFSNLGYPAPADPRTQQMPYDPRYPPPGGRPGPQGSPRARTDSSASRPPLASKASLPDIRSHDSVSNFSRPRNTSMHQPAGRPYAQPAPPSHPPPPRPPSSASSHRRGPFADHQPGHDPQRWDRSRHQSVSSTHSSATHASLAHPPAVDFNGPRPRSPQFRRGPPPPAGHYPARPPFGYNHRMDSSHSAASAPMAGGGHGPWLGGDGVRSSFRSQRTMSTNPGTNATERSSVMTGRTSLTSVEPNPEEPSIDDVMDMYGVGFEGEEEEAEYSRRIPPVPSIPSVGSFSPIQLHFDQQDQSLPRSQPQPQPQPQQQQYQPYQPYQPFAPRDSTSDPTAQYTPNHHPTNTPDPVRTSQYQHFNINIIDEEATLPMNLMDRNRRPSAIPLEESDSESLKPPPARKDIDAEIRRSKLIFASPDFMASIPHIVGSQDHDEDEEDEKDRRDSGKSITTDNDSPLHDKHSTTDELFAPVSADVNTTFTLPQPSHSSIKPTTSQSPISTRPKQPRPIIDDDPGSRDRYGFKKETQYVSRKEYDSWNKGYSEYLDRRKKKWVAFLKESSLMTDEPNRFPALSPKTRRFVRKGIPPEWRGAAWFYYAGGPSILSKHAGLYDQLLYKRAKKVDVEAIERDLHRTFPDNIKFKPPGTTDPGSGGDNMSIRSDDSEGVTGTDDEPAMISALRRVLWAFSIYNPHIGYCQSLNFIAGMLLLFVETEEQTFWLLNVITRIYLPGTHEMSLEGSKVDLSVLMTELRSAMPHIWDKIGGELDAGDAIASTRPQTSRSLRRPTRSRRNLPSVSSERLPPITLSMTAWFMSCYIGTLPVETALRVWDIFFCEGSKTLFNIALAIFKHGESEIKSVKDPMEMFGVVQSLPRKMIDANGLMEACFRKKNGISNLSQGAIESLRQERRAKAQLERQQHMSTPTGRTVDTNEEVQRKGTLFGKKKRSTSRLRGGTPRA